MGVTGEQTLSGIGVADLEVERDEFPGQGAFPLQLNSCGLAPKRAGTSPHTEEWVKGGKFGGDGGLGGEQAEHDGGQKGFTSPLVVLRGGS